MKARLSRTPEVVSIYGHIHQHYVHRQLANGYGLEATFLSSDTNASHHRKLVLNMESTASIESIGGKGSLVEATWSQGPYLKLNSNTTTTTVLVS